MTCQKEVKISHLCKCYKARVPNAIYQVSTSSAFGSEGVDFKTFSQCMGVAANLIT